MNIKVVDASAIAAVLFNEPQATDIANQLDQVSLMAPTLLWFEMASICLKKLTAHPDKRESLMKVFTLLEQFKIEAMEIDYPAVVKLAEKMGITTYDASYLWLASTHCLELVTLDKKLQKASNLLKL
jgi:predicted nucleic acid-binding protein